MANYAVYFVIGIVLAMLTGWIVVEAYPFANRLDCFQLPDCL